MQADPLLAAMFAGLGGLATLFWSAVTVWLWIADRRKPRLALVMAGIALLFTVGCLSVIPPGYDAREARRIERLHAEFAPVLEQYRRRNATYPPTLEAAGIPTPQTRYGPLEYYVRTDSTGMPEYTVRFGDYYYNGFTASWTSTDRPGDWYLDQ